MKISFTNFKWLESWERSEKHNVEVGFDNHSLLRGHMVDTVCSHVEQLPDIEFFIELAKLKPRLYSENQMTYGEITCYVDEEKYKVIYYFDKNCYMILDKNDTIIKKPETEKN